MKLNLGCGANPLAGWVNVDRVQPADYVCDLDADGLRDWIPESIHEFFASHLLEHIVNILPLMERCWRIALPNARFVARVPYGSSDDADEDPTHVRRFFLQSFGYFGQPYHWRGNGEYAGDWHCYRLHLVCDRVDGAFPTLADVMTRRNVVREMCAEMVAMKPARPRARALVQMPEIVFCDQ